MLYLKCIYDKNSKSAAGSQDSYKMYKMPLVMRQNPIYPTLHSNALSQIGNHKSITKKGGVILKSNRSSLMIKQDNFGHKCNIRLGSSDISTNSIVGV